MVDFGERGHTFSPNVFQGLGINRMFEFGLFRICRDPEYGFLDVPSEVSCLLAEFRLVDLAFPHWVFLRRFGGLDFSDESETFLHIPN